jgi:glycosyltransferase involved in cell wall biosynthesis
MAHGCPVICANFPGATEQLGEAALFFEGLDPDQAASQVLRVGEPAVRETLVRKGHELVQTRGKEEYINKINSALDQFAAMRRLWGPCNSYRHP